jgi:hypothetical protein
MNEVPGWIVDRLDAILTALVALVAGLWRRQSQKDRYEIEGEKVDIDRLRVATDVLVEIVDDQRRQLNHERMRWEKERERLIREKERAIMEGQEVRRELEERLAECSLHIKQLEELQRRLGGAGA